MAKEVNDDLKKSEVLEWPIIAEFSFVLIGKEVTYDYWVYAWWVKPVYNSINRVTKNSF